MKAFVVIFRMVRSSLRHYWRKVAAAFLIIFIFATIGFKLTETTHSWTDAAWWALVTLTTVGYGDLSPTSPTGRFLVGFPTMVLGIAVSSAFLGILMSFILETNRRKKRGMQKLKAKNHIVLVGFPSPERILKKFEQIKSDSSTQSCAVVIIDPDLDELPPELIDAGVCFVKGDPTSTIVLEKACIKEARSISVLAKPHDPVTDEKNLGVLIALQNEKDGMHIVAECQYEKHVDLFKKAGCDSVVCTELIADKLLVQEIQDPGVTQVFKELINNTVGMTAYIIEIPSEYHCVDYGLLSEKVFSEDGILLGIRRDGENAYHLQGMSLLEPGDKAIMIARERPKL